MAVRILIDYDSIKVSDYVSVKELKKMLRTAPCQEELNNTVHNNYQSIIQKILAGVLEEITLGIHDKVFSEYSSMLEKAGEELGMELEDE